MRLVLAALAAAVGLTGCATGAVPPPPIADQAAVRGGDIARSECAYCHAVGLTDDSLRMGAPPFRDLRMQYNQLSFRRRMAEIAEGGHYAMPPLRLDESQVREVAAYIESLERHGR